MSTESRRVCCYGWREWVAVLGLGSESKLSDTRPTHQVQDSRDSVDCDMGGCDCVVFSGNFLRIRALSIQLNSGTAFDKGENSYALVAISAYADEESGYKNDL